MNDNEETQQVLNVARNAVKQVNEEYDDNHNQQPKHRYYQPKFKRGWITLRVISTHEFSNRIPKFSGERILFINGVDKNGEVHHLKCYSTPKYCDMRNINNLVDYLHRLLKNAHIIRFRYFRTHGTSVATKALSVLTKSVVK